jgi:hypothetical protein
MILKRRYLEVGRPNDELVCPPYASWSTTGLLNTGWVMTRARRHWSEAKLQPITLQEARHTAATWLDAAGVRPKVASVLMGHSVPERQVGAAAITLGRYTHALPEDIERARSAQRLPREPRAGTEGHKMSRPSLFHSPRTESLCSTGFWGRAVRSRNRYGLSVHRGFESPPLRLETADSLLWQGTRSFFDRSGQQSRWVTLAWLRRDPYGRRITDKDRVLPPDIAGVRPA